MQHFTLDLRLFVNILSVMVKIGYWQSEGTTSEHNILLQAEEF